MSFMSFEMLEFFYSQAKDIATKFLPAQPIKSLPLPAPQMDVAMLTAKISASPWIKIAALSGAIAVMMGAYGAHGLKLTPEKRIIFETANKYHFYHSIAMIMVPFLRRSNLVGSLFLSGILIFSGTCYANAITGNNKVVHYTPVGGFMFILGWLSMLF